MDRVTGRSQFMFGANQVIKICKKDLSPCNRIKARSHFDIILLFREY